MKVAVLDDYQRVARGFADWDSLPAGTEVDFFHDFIPDEDAVANRLAPYEIVAMMRERTPFRRSLLERLPRLRMVATTGTHNAAIDIAAAEERGIVVSGTGGNWYSTVELAWALILATARQIPLEDSTVRRGGWQRTVGKDLRGSTLGVLGLGKIGTQVAVIGAAFGMEVVAWSQNLTSERAAAAGVRRVERDELFAASDVLTIHLVLSERTRGLVGEHELALMKVGAVLINTARGPIVDEAALIDALRSGRLRGAGLDVFWREPLPAGHALLALDNVVLTPHVGYVTELCYRRFYAETVENIAAFMLGRPTRILKADDAW